MDELQNRIKKLNPSDQEGKPKLIYGKKYNCFIDGKCVGVFTWTKDGNVGDSFQKEKLIGTQKIINVCLPDDWK